MAIVAALVAQRSDQHELMRILSGVAEVRCSGTVEPLADTLRRGRVNAVVLDVPDRPEANLAQTISVVVGVAPALPIIVWLQPSATAFRALPSAFATGARIECRVRNHDSIGEAIRQVLAPGWEPGPAALLVADLIPIVPPSLRTFFTACMVCPAPDLSLQRLLEWIGEKERTIRDRLRRLGPLGPAMIRAYAVALHASWLLDRRHLRPGQVAAALRFPNDRALRLNLKTYAQLTPDQIRAQGGFGALRQHFTQLLLGQTRPRGHGGPQREGVTEPHARDHVLPLAPLERERLLAAGILDRELAERVQHQPVAGSWSLVPVSLADLGTLFDTACRAAERGGVGSVELPRLVALRIVRIMHGLAALPDPPLPVVPPPFLSAQEAARLFSGSR